MRIACIIPNVFEALGPGNRLIIWTQGCLKHCPGCISPEFKDINAVKDLDVIKFIEENKYKYYVSGVTISGGEPFLQKEELLELVTYLSQTYDDIMIFSGMKYEELDQDPICHQIFEKIAVLVDGEYVEDLNQNEKLRGSSNQRFIFFKEKYRERYEELNKKERDQVLFEITPDSYYGVGLKKKVKI